MHKAQWIIMMLPPPKSYQVIEENHMQGVGVNCAGNVPVDHVINKCHLQNENITL